MQRYVAIQAFDTNLHCCAKDFRLVIYTNNVFDTLECGILLIFLNIPDPIHRDIHIGNRHLRGNRVTLPP
jgi:hypothetical protein